MFLLLLVALQTTSPGPIAAGSESLDQAYVRLASRRTQQIERVRRYAAESRFPRNRDFPGELVPYFVDAADTPCAVGHLMLCDGWRGAVAGVVAADNHVRIENLRSGPVVDWARGSGLTLAECALIQPSYACIEDYRKGRQWSEEIERLQRHFEDVEKRLIDRTTASLAESLAAEVDRRLRENPADPALGLAALKESLKSDEPAVRIAAARALAHESLRDTPREIRLAALRGCLDDPDAAVRFWSAASLRRIGSSDDASPHYVFFRGPTSAEVQLNAQTGPVFLATWREGPPELRYAALVQIARVTPESIGTSMQVRWAPAARRVMVEACDDEDPAIAAFAQERLRTFRWQRTVFESQRMRRQYLATTHADEALAAELALLGECFAPASEIVSRVDALRTTHGHSQSMVYLLPNAAELPIVTAATPIEAQQKVASELARMYGRFNNEPPEQQLVEASPDESGLYTHLHYVGGGEASLPLHYVVPTPEMLKHSNMPPQEWTQGRQSKIEPMWPAGEAMVFDFKEGIDVALGEAARTSREAFESACDLLCYFLGYRSRILVERDSSVQGDALVWRGRFANLRQHRPRFYEIEGGGSSTYGGGGWDFQEVEIRCDRETGQLTLSTTPQVFPLEQLGAEELDPPWTRDEKRRMGWAPLPGIDFYGDTLFPPEYVAAVESFEPADKPAFNSTAHRRHHMEKGLPSPHFLSAMLYAEEGLQEQEELCLRLAASAATPLRVAEIAQWQLSRGRLDEARELANLCLKKWPGQPAAAEVLSRLDAAEAQKR